MQEFSQDFKDFLRLLDDCKVAYMIVGGYAVGFHGHPRFTGDLDVWVRSSAENGRNILKALEVFGFPTSELSEKDFLSTDLILQIGRRPLRIDIMTSATGLDFETCYKRLVPHRLGDHEVNFISLEDLRANKMATGRSIDLSDLDNLS